MTFSSLAIGARYIRNHAGKPAGERRIEARVTNAEFAFDSPAIFRLDHPEVKEIFCYSHTYAGQALPGETIEAKGVLEETCSWPSAGGGNHTRGSRRMDQIAHLAGKLKQ